MIEKIISEILNEITNESELKEVLYRVLGKYEIKEKSSEIRTVDKTWKKELSDFLTRKMIDGRSEGTIKLYKLHLSRMLSYINKPVKDIAESDLFMYISVYKKTRNVSNVYLENIRLSFSSFFGWLNNKGYIPKNPASGLDPIKTGKKIKKPFSEIEMEKIRMSCDTIRDRAMLEFLYSTGIRVSELTKINRDDIDYEQMEVVVNGKGNKERTVYLTPIACMHLKMYIKSRNDDNTTLFASLRRPFKRMSKEGIENAIRKIGKMAGVEKCHPHRLRRTMATSILNKGMPVEEVREILGHSKLDTTMLYCQVSKENVKHNHKKYMSQ